MRVTWALLLSILISGTHAIASAGAGSGEGLSLLATFFIAFAALILLFQLLPGITLFLGMLKGVFSLGKKTEQARKP